MLDLLYQFINIICDQTKQQQALSLIVIGAIGLGIIGLLVRLVSKIKAAAFLGG